MKRGKKRRKEDRKEETYVSFWLYSLLLTYVFQSNLNLFESREKGEL